MAAEVPAGPGYAQLDAAYRRLQEKDYDEAIRLFREALAADANRAGVHKDLAYTYLKTGEREAARDEFREAMRLDPADAPAALEYAFLCYETKQTVTARRLFDHYRRKGNRTAAQAFDNIDRPLAEGIERWRKVVADSPANFSAHLELARLAEQRDEIELAAREYAAARKLRPERRELLLDEGRVLKALGRAPEANAMLLAASRSKEGTVAEAARELMPGRYPYVYEFRDALALDPDNLELHRELAYLLLEMRQSAEAEKEFRLLVERAPDDLLSVAQLGFLLLARRDMAGAKPLLDRVLQGKDEDLADRVRSALKLPQLLKRKNEETPRAQVGIKAKELAEHSLQAGYLKDARKYLEIAQESDPLDFEVMLKLGWANNILHDDRQALPWFQMAKKSPDTAIAREARRAAANLSGDQRPVTTTLWVYPFYSSRWRDAFSYAQVKTELHLFHLPLTPYLSARFDGDTRQSVPGLAAGYLSDGAMIAAIGLATPTRHGITLWGEAGRAFSYLKDHPGGPDYRGGLSFGRGFGHLLGAARPGALFESNDDAVFLSRFDHDLLFYSQNRLGYSRRLGGLALQLHWNLNITADARRQYWANTMESGPGVRIRVDGMPRSMILSFDLLRGAYFINAGNPWPPVYNDVRVGVWYAMSR